MLGRKTRQTRADAEMIAVQAFAFLAAEPARLDRFLALSGLSPDDVAAMAATSGFLSEVLAHLASDESALLVFAADAGLDPQAVVAAEALLR